MTAIVLALSLASAPACVGDGHNQCVVPTSSMTWKAFSRAFGKPRGQDGIGQESRPCDAPAL